MRQSGIGNKYEITVRNVHNDESCRLCSDKTVNLDELNFLRSDWTASIVELATFMQRLCRKAETVAEPINLSFIPIATAL